MRRLQVIEAMNYSEKRGWPYVVTWDREIQFTITLGERPQVAEIIGWLEMKEMPIDLSKLGPDGRMIR